MSTPSSTTARRRAIAQITLQKDLALGDHRRQQGSFLDQQVHLPLPPAVKVRRVDATIASLTTTRQQPPSGHRAALRSMRPVPVPAALARPSGGWVIGVVILLLALVLVLVVLVIEAMVRLYNGCISSPPPNGIQATPTAKLLLPTASPIRSAPTTARRVGTLATSAIALDHRGRVSERRWWIVERLKRLADAVNSPELLAGTPQRWSSVCGAMTFAPFITSPRSAHNAPDAGAGILCAATRNGEGCWCPVWCWR